LFSNHSSKFSLNVIFFSLHVLCINTSFASEKKHFELKNHHFSLGEFGRILPLPQGPEQTPLNLMNFLSDPLHKELSRDPYENTLMQDIYKHLLWEPETQRIGIWPGTSIEGMNTFENGFSMVTNPDVLPKAILGFEPHHFLMKPEEFKHWFAPQNWVVVSYRIDPCSVEVPLPQEILQLPSREFGVKGRLGDQTLEELFCVPMVRLVAQPMQAQYVQPDGRKGADADDKALHLSYLAVSRSLFQRLSTPETTDVLSGKTLNREDITRMVAPYVTHRKALLKARTQLLVAVVQSTNLFPRSPTDRIPNTAAELLAYANFPEKELVFNATHKLLNPFCKPESLLRVTTMMSAARRMYMINWSFGSLEVDPDSIYWQKRMSKKGFNLQGVATKLIPSKIGIISQHGQGNDFKVAKLFDLNFFDVLKNSRTQISDDRTQLVDLFDRDFQFQGMEAQATQSFGESASEIISTYASNFTFMNSLSRAPESRTDILKPFANVIDPAKSNRHMLSCSTCHVSDGLLRFQLDANGNRLTDAFATMPLETLKGSFDLTPEGGIEGQDPYETENIHALGYFFSVNNKPKATLSFRSLAEIVASRDLANKFVRSDRP
jgi:hypothetical protein